MMEGVRPSRPTFGGVEVARRGVAGRLQLTLSDGADIHGGFSNLYPYYPIYVIRRRWRRVKETLQKIIRL